MKHTHSGDAARDGNRGNAPSIAIEIAIVFTLTRLYTTDSDIGTFLYHIIRRLRPNNECDYHSTHSNYLVYYITMVITAINTVACRPPRQAHLVLPGEVLKTS